MKNKFPEAHFDPARGSIRENRDYVSKQGKWEGTEKEETVVEGSFKEIGDLPEEKMESTDRYRELIRLIKARTPINTIIDILPNYSLRIKQVEQLREQILGAEYRNKIRDIKVVYIEGDTGVGKTRYIYEKFGYENVCRVTKYPDINGVKFDEYDFHQVLVFDEFRSQIPIAEMLMYLDIYPIELPARYYNRVAAYEYVFIVSNIPFEQQYSHLKNRDYKTYKAWLRRIHEVYKMDHEGNLINKKKEGQNHV